jgi:transcriptional regulator with XRE-family HTH domain
MNELNGAWLREWRMRNNYSQAQLAAELEVTRQSVIKWEQSNQLDRILGLALIVLERDTQLQKIAAR